MKRTICIDCFSHLPVPAVRGGAVETLFTILMEENERFQRINLVIVSPYDRDAQRESLKYKHTKIVYVKKCDTIKKIYNRGIRTISKLFQINNFLEYDYVMENLYLSRVNADFYLTSGCGNHYNSLVRRKGMENVAFYIHTEVKATDQTDKIFRKALGVSDYVTNKYYETSKWDRENGKTVLNCTDEKHLDKIVNEKEKEELLTKLGFEEDDFIVLYSGRIIEEKGIHILIEAINRIEDKHIKLIICGGVNSGAFGTSEYQKKIEKYVEESEGRIVCTGFIDHALLYKFFYISNVQAMISLCEEAAPLSAIEGMHCGIPLIVTDSGGIGEYVTEECAITVTRDERLVENIAEKILLLKNDSSLRKRMSDAGKQRAKMFTRERYYNDFVDALIDWK